MAELPVLAPVLPVFAAVLAAILTVFPTILAAVLPVLTTLLAILRRRVGAIFAALLPVLAAFLPVLLTIPLADIAGQGVADVLVVAEQGRVRITGLLRLLRPVLLAVFPPLLAPLLPVFLPLLAVLGRLGASFLALFPAFLPVLLPFLAVLSGRIGLRLCLRAGYGAFLAAVLARGAAPAAGLFAVLGQNSQRRGRGHGKGRDGGGHHK